MVRYEEQRKLYLLYDVSWDQEMEAANRECSSNPHLQLLLPTPSSSWYCVEKLAWRS